MIRNPVVVACALLASTSAFAQAQGQGFEGLDLTKPTPKAVESAAVAKDGLSPGASPSAAASDPTVVKSREQNERDVTQGDLVRSVQKKLYLKRGRFELAPYFFVNINDAYFTKLGASLRMAFYPADSLAIALRLAYIVTSPTDDVRTARRNFNATVYNSEPIASGMLDVEWSPIYGKLAIFNSIRQFDAYLLAGAGGVWTRTSGAADPSVSGLKPGFEFGIGLRFIALDWLAINLAFINTTYLDIPTGTSQSSAQNLTTLNIGISFFFPLHSTYREVE